MSQGVGQTERPSCFGVSIPPPPPPAPQSQAMAARKVGCGCSLGDFSSCRVPEQESGPQLSADLQGVGGKHGQALPAPPPPPSLELAPRQ